jgi:hypothetical protein
MIRSRGRESENSIAFLDSRVAFSGIKQINPSPTLPRECYCLFSALA